MTWGALGVLVLVIWFLASQRRAKEAEERAENERQIDRNSVRTELTKVEDTLGDLCGRADEVVFADVLESWVMALDEAAHETGDEALRNTIAKLNEEYSERRYEALGPAGEWLGSKKLPRWATSNVKQLEAFERDVAEHVETKWSEIFRVSRSLRRRIVDAHREAQTARRSDYLTEPAVETARKHARDLRVKARELTRELEALEDEHEL